MSVNVLRISMCLMREWRPRIASSQALLACSKSSGSAFFISCTARDWTRQPALLQVRGDTIEMSILRIPSQFSAKREMATQWFIWGGCAQSHQRNGTKHDWVGQFLSACQQCACAQRSALVVLTIWVICHYFMVLNKLQLFSQRFLSCNTYFYSSIGVVRACWLRGALALLCVGPAWREPGVTLA